MKVSHEVPKSLLSISRVLNDYDYCLPHLLDIDEEYKEFFIKSKEYGRYIIMDNSLHELGKAYDEDRLIYWIDYLKPDEFIIPDVWENPRATLENAKKWAEVQLPEETTKVVVIQGKEFSDLYWLTKKVKELGYKKLAYSYGLSLYNDIAYHPSEHYRKVLGRVTAINALFEDGFLDSNDRVHLLGCQLPQEFQWYKGVNIESIDTSNPVMAALEGIKYKTYGLEEKPKANMNTYFNIPFEDIDVWLLKYNTEKFKQINGIKKHKTS